MAMRQFEEQYQRLFQRPCVLRMIVSNPQTLIAEYQRCLASLPIAWLETPEGQAEHAVLQGREPAVLSAEKDEFYQERLGHYHSDMIATTVCSWGQVTTPRPPRVGGHALANVTVSKTTGEPTKNLPSSIRCHGRSLFRIIR